MHGGGGFSQRGSALAMLRKKWMLMQLYHVCLFPAPTIHQLIMLARHQHCVLGGIANYVTTLSFHQAPSGVFPVKQTTITCPLAPQQVARHSKYLNQSTYHHPRLCATAGDTMLNQPIVSVEWLRSNLNKVKVLDATWYLPTVGTF